MGAEKNGRTAFGLSAVLQIFGWGYPGEYPQMRGDQSPVRGKVRVLHRGAYQLPPEFHPYGQWVRIGKMWRGW